jgi:DNA-binding response OmpR family regulator
MRAPQRRRELAAGADEYLVEPFEPQALVAAVRRVLATAHRLIVRGANEGEAPDPLRRVMRSDSTSSRATSSGVTDRMNMTRQEQPTVSR